MPKVKGQAQVEKKNKALSQLQIQYVSTESIAPNDYNPNRQDDHDFELLMRSMKEDGFTQPIIVHAKTKQIVDGEHRWRAAQQLGMAEIPVVFVDMELAQMKISTLRHNRARGSEDIELTAQLMRDLEELGAKEWMQDSLMLDDVEMERLMNEINVPEVLAGDDFSIAWEPEIAGTEAAMALDDDNIELNRQIPDGSGDLVNTAMSQQAADMLRARQAALAQAKTAEEREMIRKDSDIYRITLMFAGDEGGVVKTVLGAKPAPAIVKLCKYALDKGLIEELGLAE